MSLQVPGLSRISYPRAYLPQHYQRQSSGPGGVIVSDDHIHRINPATNTVDLSKEIMESRGHYTYSDMTGIVLRTITTRIGSWSFVFDSAEANTPWGMISWTGQEPVGTSIMASVRSSNDGLVWSSRENAPNGVQLSLTPMGRYLAVEITLQVFTGDVSPILYDLTVESKNFPPTAVDDDGKYSTDEDTILNVAAPGILDNDTDPNNDSLMVTSVDDSGTIGIVNWNPDGSFSYDPNDQFEALTVGQEVVDTFTYSISDGKGGIDTGDVPITITGVYDPPSEGDLVIRAFSPVNLKVTDPLGNTIDMNGGTVPGASYTELELNSDNDVDDLVLIPNPITGIYSIDVSAEAGAQPNETFTLDASCDGSSVTLAQNVQVQNIPNEPYYIFICVLANSWNLMSIGLQPEDTAPGPVFSSIENKFDSVWGFNSDNDSWKIYIQGVPSALTAVVPEEGYWIKMNEPAILLMKGTLAGLSTISLRIGWNLIGFGFRFPVPAETVFDSVNDKIDSVWAFGPGSGWAIYIPNVPSALGIIICGEGYWIKAIVDTIITLP